MKVKKHSVPETKESKKQRALKASRIIVRNLPFTTNEENLKAHFSQYGNVLEVNLLKKGDKLVGCGFVQFDKKNSAAKAIYRSNMVQFLGRRIVSDWALPKDKFVKLNRPPKKEIKQEAVKKEENIKNESDSEVELSDYEFQNEPVVDKMIKSKTSSTDVVEVKSESSSSESDESNDNGKWKDDYQDETSNDEEDSEDYEPPSTPLVYFANEDSSDEETTCKDEGSNHPKENNTEEGSPSRRVHYPNEDPTDEETFDTEEYNTYAGTITVKDKKKRRPLKNDVSEGKTVFLTNVPFDVSQQELYKFLKEKFGELLYVTLCIDALTEHSKGSAFAKFKTVESAENCIASCHEEELQGRNMIARPAVSKQNLESRKEKLPKDNRNLYLAKEGVVLPGSAAAMGVSKADMEKRVFLEQRKTEKLKNLNMFVSRSRLLVHNIPPNMTDKQLTRIFKRCTPNAKVKGKIMRFLKELDANGRPKSKGYGFIDYDHHDNAISALRAINNNPNIFTPTHRPIVAFSIENLQALRLKAARADLKRESKANQASEPVAKKQRQASSSNQGEGSNEVSKYQGLTGEPGSKRLFNKKNFKKQSAKIAEVAKKMKGEKKLKKKKVNRKQREKKLKSQKKPESKDEFSKLVDSYKSKLSNMENKKKWFDE